ncbi:RluA family pseudouridine synthase [bacterium]|nr:RluA family pseudouridine synthase [bacterium]
MNNFIEIRVDEETAGERLDSFVSSQFTEFSRSKIQKLIKEEKILLNNKKAKVATILKEGDIVAFDKPDGTLTIQPQNIELDVRFEDDDMLVVNKPKNMLTHPTVLETENTLVNALLFKYGKSLSDLNGEMRPGIVHRLDRNTSGLLMIAKNNNSHSLLAEKIKQKTAKRNYLAVVSGNLDFETKTISAPIGRNPSNPAKMAVIEGGKPSVTHVKVLERFKGYTYVELELETGRTHQIRVHLSHIGHPIVNDTFYGGKQLGVKTTEQVLQAYQLTFNRLNDNILTTITLEPDEDIKRVLNYLRSKKG